MTPITLKEFDAVCEAKDGRLDLSAIRAALVALESRDHENELLRAALHLLHGHACRQSDFTYGVLHGKPAEEVAEWITNRNALASVRREDVAAALAELKRREGVANG